MKVRILKSIRLAGEHVPIGAYAEVSRSLGVELIHGGQAVEDSEPDEAPAPEPAEEPPVLSKKAGK